MIAQETNERETENHSGWLLGSESVTFRLWARAIIRSDAYPNTNIYSDAHRDADTHANVHTNSDSDFHSHIHAYLHSNRYNHAHRHSYTHRHPNA